MSVPDGARLPHEEWIDAEAGVPQEIRQELLDCAASNGRISYIYLLRLYKRGRVEAFVAGWSAGFQEAQTPDTYPHQDRCAVAYDEWITKAAPSPREERPA